MGLIYGFFHALFDLCLHIFYAAVEVQGAENVPPDGEPTILIANHSNSLTDAITIVSQTPRSCVRLTAKDTLWRHPFFRVFVQGVGTIPIQRRSDHAAGSVSNDDAFRHLKEAVEAGDVACLFPEGISRYHPSLAPLKRGVAAIALDILKRQRGNPSFRLHLLTCGITYLHREKFRSNVSVCFDKPITLDAASVAHLLDQKEQGEELLTAALSTLR